MGGHGPPVHRRTDGTLRHCMCVYMVSLQPELAQATLAPLCGPRDNPPGLGVVRSDQIRRELSSKTNERSECWCCHCWVPPGMGEEFHLLNTFRVRSLPSLYSAHEPPCIPPRTTGYQGEQNVDGPSSAVSYRCNLGWHVPCGNGFFIFVRPPPQVKYDSSSRAYKSTTRASAAKTN